MIQCQSNWKRSIGCRLWKVVNRTAILQKDPGARSKAITKSIYGPTERNIVLKFRLKNNRIIKYMINTPHSKLTRQKSKDREFLRKTRTLD